MNRQKILGILLGSIFFIGLAFFMIGFLKPKTAGILIESDPKALVFMDDIEMGSTPYEASVKAGETKIKLISESDPNATYETKVNLTPGIKTVIRRNLDPSNDATAGEIISFEKTGADETSIAVVSVPDSGQVVLDGVPRGFTPLKISNVVPGQHQITIAGKGYFDRTFSINIVTGFKLTSIVKLAVNKDAQKESANPVLSAATKVVDQVQILNTPTGFLRVRETPSSAGSEIGQAKPGERYDLVSRDDNIGWFEIQLNNNKTGWVSAQYATISGVPKN